MRIDVTVVDSVPLGVDTPHDLDVARRMLGGHAGDQTASEATRADP
jgi:3-deoxy-manno-octulosonate cytidylyltransferase (CMP-KDO synthetase)